MGYAVVAPRATVQTAAVQTGGPVNRVQRVQHNSHFAMLTHPVG